jgi:N-acetylglucosaminyl-diphospho-decaprenol L-rhamnosyltransferase
VSGPYSIVVVTWQSAGHLAALVESMNRHLDDRPELVVVDNDSDDDPEGAARGWDGELRLLPLGENRGYGAAANVGVREARGEAVVLLNPDTELLDSGLGELARFALERRALAGPRLLDPDGSPQPSASGPPVGIWPWLGAVVPGRLQPDALLAHTEAWRLGSTTRVAWLTGACVAGPRAVLRELGPFDPAIEMFGEDLDLCLRADRAGVPSYFHPAACSILHHGGASAAVRWEGGAGPVVALTRRAVLRRAFGPRPERAAWLAQRLNLRLRVVAKRALRRDASRDAAALSSAAGATPVPDLPPPPPPPSRPA